MNEAQEKLCAVCLEGTEMPDCPLLEPCEQYKVLQKEEDDMGCPRCEWFEGRVWHLEDNIHALINTLQDIRKYVEGGERWARRTILSKIEEDNVEWNDVNDREDKKAQIRGEVEKLLSIHYVYAGYRDDKGCPIYKAIMRDAQTAPSVDEVVEAIMVIFEE